MRRFSLVALGAALFSTPLVAQAVRYDVTLMSTTEKQFHVAADFPAAGKETLFVSLPAWSPGNYEIQNYAKYVHAFSAKNSAGQSLRWDRGDKDTWHVVTGRADRVTVEFDFIGRHGELGILQGEVQVHTVLKLLERRRR